MKKRQTLKVSFILVCALFFGGCATQPQKAIAPSGALRVGLYLGSPTSIIPGDSPATTRGVSYELGRDLANSLGIPFEPIVFQKNAEVLVAAKEGKVDLLLTNATPARAKDYQFSKTVFRVEQGYLVGSTSSLQSIDQVDKKGINIGVSIASSSEASLSSHLKNATLVRTKSLDDALLMLKSGKLDAFSTNKAILYELSDQLKGSRILSGTLGYENFALGVPLGREEVIPYLNGFIDRMNASGRMAEIIKFSGIRGVAVN